MLLPDLHNCFSEFVLKQRRQFMHINTVSDWVKCIISELLLHTFCLFHLHDPLKPGQIYGPKEQKRCVSGSVSGWSGADATGRVCHSPTLHHHRARDAKQSRDSQQQQTTALTQMQKQSNACALQNQPPGVSEPVLKSLKIGFGKLTVGQSEYSGTTK